MSWTKVVAITGCDSGLGWAVAARAAREGFITIAGMYNGTNTEAAKSLKRLCVHPHKLDITDPASVVGFHDYVKSILHSNNNYKLYAIVNNAGVMTIGDYEWQTQQIIENTINVNLLGPMRVTSTFLPDLRKNGLDGRFNPRIINVASHCGLQPLPGFGPYSASKAGLLAWTRTLNLEQSHMGLKTIVYIPGRPGNLELYTDYGGFVGASNLMTCQSAKGTTMLEHLNEDQKSLYGKKIRSLNDYLKHASNNSTFDSLKDEKIIETFMKALTDEYPKKMYKVESWRYKLYYNLLKIPFPDKPYRWLIKKFLNFPE